MAIDLKRLIQLRERRRCVAQQALAQQQRATEARQAAVTAARTEWQRQVDLQAGLWRDAAQAPGLSVSALRDMSAWSGSLNSGIAHAARAVHDGEQALAAERAQLAERRTQLRQAAGALTKAETLHERMGRELRRTAEQRLEDAADEAATQGWRAGRLGAAVR